MTNAEILIYCLKLLPDNNFVRVKDSDGYISLVFHKFGDPLRHYYGMCSSKVNKISLTDILNMYLLDSSQPELPAFTQEYDSKKCTCGASSVGATIHSSWC